MQLNVLDQCAAPTGTMPDMDGGTSSLQPIACWRIPAEHAIMEAQGVNTKTGRFLSE